MAKAKPKTVIDLLAQQSDEELRVMRDENRKNLARAQEEVSRLKVENQQIEAAIKRRAGAKAGGRLTQDEVLSVAAQIDSPFTAAEVTEIFELFDRGVKVNTVRNHLNRLVTAKKLGKDEESGHYFVLKEFVPKVTSQSVSDDDIPF